LSKGLDGKPRKGPYADKNPIFTRHAFANESYAALESTLARGLQFKHRLDFAALRLAVAAGVADETIEEMYAVWEEREKEIEKKGAPPPKKECESWIDVAGAKVCAGDEFWKTVGRVQAIERGALKIEGCVFLFLSLFLSNSSCSSAPLTRSLMYSEPLTTYAFDRYLPSVRDESLPLVVLYAAPTDENFPVLFEFLYNLAQPRFGKARVQFAIRWKPDTKVVTVGGFPDFSVEAIVKSGVEVEDVKDVAGKLFPFSFFSSASLIYPLRRLLRPCHLVHPARQVDQGQARRSHRCRDHPSSRRLRRLQCLSRLGFRFLPH
jgi:hypothetical protein